MRASTLAQRALTAFAAAQRSHDHRCGWLLSAAIAAGLTIASFYDFITAAVTPAVPTAGPVTFVVISLCAIRGATRRRPRR